jgi:hypothetical protein
MGAAFQARLRRAGGLSVVHKQRENKNYRQRNADQPQKCASAKAHGFLLTFD